MSDNQQGRGRGAHRGELPIRGGRGRGAERGRGVNRGRGGSSERGRGAERGRGGSSERGRGPSSSERGRGDSSERATTRGGSSERATRGSGSDGTSTRGSSDRGRGDFGRSRGEGFGRGRGRGDFGRGRGGDHDSGRGRGGFGRGRGGPMEMQLYVPPDGRPATEERRVTRIENETSKAMAGSPLGLFKRGSVEEPSMPTRPAFHSLGKEILLWTNHMEPTFKEDRPLYRYHIEVKSAQGKEPTGRKLRRVIELLLEDKLAQYTYEITTDFKSNLISQIDLDPEEEGFAITYRADDEDEPLDGAMEYSVRLQQTGTLTAGELIEQLASTSASELFGSKEEILQAINIVMGHHPKATANIASIGANKHFLWDSQSSERFDLGAGLMALRGFFISARAATGRILINVQVKHAAFFQEGTLDQLMYAYMADNGPNRVKLANFIKRIGVSPTHITRKKNKKGLIVKRRKVITGFALPQDGREMRHSPIVPRFAGTAAEVQFFMTDSPTTAGENLSEGASPTGRYISVADYFKEKWNVTVTDVNLPVVNVGTRQNPSYLPAQVCEVLPGQVSGSKLSSVQTQNMIRFAVRRPADNAHSIVDSGSRMLGFEPANPTLSKFGIDVKPDLLTVPGRVLQSPEIHYAGNKTASVNNGSWNLQALRFLSSKPLEYWTYLWISVPRGRDPWRNDNELLTTLTEFSNTLRDTGINAANPVRGQHITISPNSPETELDEAIQKFARAQKVPQIVLVLLPSADTSVYNKVKYLCDIRHGLLCVCVQSFKFAKQRNVQYFANVALKFNLKLGGRNHSLTTNKIGILAEGRTMVCGLDVTHPSPGSSSGAPSVAAIVASVDRHLAQWPADIRIQTARQEMIADLKGLLQGRLQHWQRLNGQLPENIIVYRDGVSEGEYNLVVDKELPQLREACKLIYPATMTKEGLPRMSIIVVGKRHHVRFYPTKKENADRSGNPKNGTVVDRGVTEARNWDFYLQAHTAIQGTARPAHYYVVYDEIFQLQRPTQPSANTADVLLDLTHNLCYLFGRASKAVSRCPPAYYADLVCERARCYLSGVFDPTPGASPAASVISGDSGRRVDANMVALHARVQNSMFYI